ncbi:2OG-Fe(II) oxygenase [Pontibacterium granulatum]|uniref:2OG-Fe(II) oxygenase n=1 Tax=Pontibacterium granulatum TaxID=2036029 RepID=UPI00249A0F49|nr:2OG-Fe(II) oxygenase [Pontibacterium granulatum]MDI3324005.1 2OG-Fe(II) oxygenase [Pontibacterium granulatum]
MSALAHKQFMTGDVGDDTLFAKIAADIRETGYSINPCALPPHLVHSLSSHLAVMDEEKFNAAGIGRDNEHMNNSFVRRDSICWINGDVSAGREWLDWTGRLKTYINRKLILGLFSFESHFAHYSPGAFYKRHVDAFRGEANRVLTMVVYLNRDWTEDDGGELVLYTSDTDQDGIKVTPAMGTVVVFLSEEFPHEVLPSYRDRFSIAGWYRVNTSTTDRVDPPR